MLGRPSVKSIICGGTLFRGAARPRRSRESDMLQPVRSCTILQHGQTLKDRRGG